MKLEKPVLEKIADLRYLPTLPHITLKLITACNRETCDLKDIGAILEKDPSLTGRVLRLVNSAFYGLPRKIGTMDQAVGFLGLNAIKSIAICSSLHEAFSKANGGGGFDMKAFWWHSLRCALLARNVAKKIRYGSPDEAFLSGLLHDIGQLVLWVNGREGHAGLPRDAKAPSRSVSAYEAQSGISHAAVGAWLLNRWNLSSFMVDAVMYHHEEAERIKTALPLVQIVYAANLLSGSPSPSPEQFHTAENLVGLKTADLEGLVSLIEEELKEVASSLGIEIAMPAEQVKDADEEDGSKRDTLIEQTRNISSLVGLLQGLVGAITEEDLLKELYQGFHILFDLDHIHFFLFDKEKEGLQGTGFPGRFDSPDISNVFIPLRFKESVLIQCLLSGMIKDVFGAGKIPSPSILDEQLVRFIGKEGMCCVPLLAQGHHVGVAAIGLDRPEADHLTRDLQLIKIFMDQAALALHAHRLRQQQLTTLQSERLMASSTMARRVVHEVNNPLGIIKNYLKILGMKLLEQGVVQDEIRIIDEEIDRVVTILRDLTEFSDSKVMRAEPLDVNLLIEDLLKLIRDAALKNAKVRVHSELAPGLPKVKADRNGLKQVLINLMKNGVEALTDGGNLHLKTRLLSPRLSGGNAQEGSAADGYVEITVSDDGPGIPESVRSQIFDPFFTSKGGSHSGIGLSVVHRIVKAMNGSIRCETEQGKGTAFKITLPIAGN